MKLLTSLTLTVALAAPLLAQTPTPTQSTAEAQAKQELEQAARMYREGKYAEAQAHSEKALLLDPQNKIAPFFVARTIHAQFKPGDSTPENIAKARDAIVAYQRVLNISPGDEEAYKAIAYLFGALKEHALLRAWLFQRANDVSIADDKRAEALIVLASKDWECSFNITEQPVIKVTIVIRNKPSVRYQMPEDQVEFERAKKCANRGLDMVNMAITLSPESESAWSYKTNILLELAKLAEMSGDEEQKRELHRQYEDALTQTTNLTKRSKRNSPDQY